MEQEEGVSYRARSAFRKSRCFRCDNQCSEKSLSLWELVSVVIKEGEESHITNLCQKCYDESLPLTKWQWHEFVEKKAHCD